MLELGEDQGNEVMITADLHGNRLHFDRLWEVADLDGLSVRSSTGTELRDLWTPAGM